MRSPERLCDSFHEHSQSARSHLDRTAADMTTDSRTGTAGTRGLVRATAATLALGSVLVLVAAIASGSSAAAGAVVGTLVVVAVLAWGAFSVNLVAGVLPTASLIVAVVTYGAQIATTVLALVVLNRSGMLDDGTIDRGWVAAGVVVAALGWSAAQIIAFVRLRIPIYDLFEPGAR